MQAAGGIDWMVAMAARIIEKRPNRSPSSRPDGVPLLHRFRDGQHHLPAVTGDLRRVVQEPHPTLATPDGHRRAVRHRTGRVARLCRHGGHAHPHRRRTIRPGPRSDPRDHAARLRHRHHRDLPRRQPDVEGPRRRPRGAGEDRIRGAGPARGRRCRRPVGRCTAHLHQTSRNSALAFLLGVVAIVVFGPTCGPRGRSTAKRYRST